MIEFTTAAGPIASDNAASAQEVRPTTLQPDVGAGDGALLAAIGLELKAIETCEDAGLLWSAVREVVLPGRVAEATQQRILRRVWIVDPDIRHGSFTGSQTD